MVTGRKKQNMHKIAMWQKTVEEHKLHMNMLAHV